MHSRQAAEVRVLTDRVKAWRTACITTSRAAKGGRGLCRGIADEVTGSGAAALESMVQTDPVTNLVSERLMSRTDVRENGLGRKKNQLKTHPAQVVGSGSPAGNRGEEDNNTVVYGVAGVGPRESSISEKS